MNFMFVSCVCFLFFLTVLVGCSGQGMTGEGKSLMEQLRGEALKFHKTGEKEPPEQLQAALLVACFSSHSIKSNLKDLLTVDLSSSPSIIQERTIKPRAMWSHQRQWTCLKSTWRSLVDRYKLYMCYFWRRNIKVIMFIDFFSPFHLRIPLDSYSFSSRAQRYPSHWTRQSHQLQFWLCKGTCLSSLYHHRISFLILSGAAVFLKPRLFL